MKPQDFRETVWDYYQKHGRDLPWRRPPFNAYHILISEFMLQQTQVSRVVPKYIEFLEKFPSIETLAQASLADVIRAWSGLGYNRRAKYLHQAASQLMAAKQPWSLEDLTSCTGIGPNTAAAIITYCYDQPLVFVETNIRTVYIYHFFRSQDGISDKDLLPLIEDTLDHEHPREFAWALMDYGSHLKASVGNFSRSSKHHTKQSRFEGSKRQIRGQVLRLLHQKALSRAGFEAEINDERLPSVIDELAAEGLIEKTGGKYRLTS